MISFIKTWGVTSGVVLTALVIGVLSLRVQSLKTDVAEAQDQVVDLQGQLASAKAAIEGYKGTIDGKDAEIAGCREQARAVAESVDAYKERMDKLATMAGGWKNVPVEKIMGVLDEKSNSEAIKALNALVSAGAASVAPGVRGDTGKSGILPAVR